jgi:predicted DNA-binding transcriptional regulator AlpA
MNASVPASYWTVADVADCLKVSRQWVYHHAELGTFPGVHRFGALLRFNPETVRRWASEQEHKSPLKAGRVIPFVPAK